jgi:hypothetical protein
MPCRSRTRRDVAPSDRHVASLAILGVLGARQGYSLRGLTMLGDKVPGGASNLMGAVHE